MWEVMLAIIDGILSIIDGILDWLDISDWPFSKKSKKG